MIYFEMVSYSFLPSVYPPIAQFAENQLSGSIPEEVKFMGNLQTFSVHNREVGSGLHTGQLPPFDRHPFLNEI